MALFEFEDGHLVPAQFGYPVSHDLGPELVDAICQQVLQIVSRPLFPVTWRDMTGQVGEETPRLTALDVTGQIVSVEILKLLDSETLITSLSRLAVVASLSWSDLAAEYPSGPEGFRAGWAQFRDSMPPAVGPGPRLIMVAGEIDPAVRPALSILATSGVEVHLMNLRQMSNGRLFLDVNAVGPRLYGHAPQLLGSSAAAPAITAGSVPAEAEASAESAEFESAEFESAEFESTIDASEQDEAPAIPAPPAPLSADTDEEDAAEPETPTTRPTPKVAPHLRDVFRYSVDEEPPAPWKSEDDGQDQAQDAAEEQLDEAGADREDQAEESAEAELEDERGADAEKAPSDELVDQESDDTEGVDADSDDAESANEAEADDERDEAEDHEAETSEHSDEQGQDGDAYVAEDHEDSEGEDSGDDLGGFEHDHPEELDNEEADVDGEQRWERPAHLGSRASRRSHSEPVELNDGGATEAATASFVDREEESPEVVAAREEGVPVLGRDEDGLRTLAQILGEDTPLVARGELGLPNDLMLAVSGAISGAGLTYPSLDTMLTARGMSHIDVWSLVRIGDRLGPTLAEALDEVNREIVREYANAPRERRIARH